MASSANTKVYSKYSTTDYRDMIPLGDGIFIKSLLYGPEGLLRISVDVYDWQVDERDGKEKWVSLGYDKRKDNAKEGQGLWFTVRDWQGMKDEMEPFREKASRRFDPSVLPITTANFNPTLADATTNHCLMVVSDNGQTLFLIVGTRWTEGEVYIVCIYISIHVYINSHCMLGTSGGLLRFGNERGQCAEIL
jgi:hypothetical protein